MFREFEGADSLVCLGLAYQHPVSDVHLFMFEVAESVMRASECGLAHESHHRSQSMCQFSHQGAKDRQRLRSKGGVTAHVTKGQ